MLEHSGEVLQHLRLERAQANAAELVVRLGAHPAISEVRYPGFGAMAAFEVAGPHKAVPTVPGKAPFAVPQRQHQGLAVHAVDADADGSQCVTPALQSLPVDHREHVVAIDLAKAADLIRVRIGSQLFLDCVGQQRPRSVPASWRQVHPRQQHLAGGNRQLHMRGTLRQLCHRALACLRRRTVIEQ